ncbi:MAG: hypothetical protein UV58_C0026G0001 [Candidatus Wolfebacteria bacterium GW2011_GWC1_43_10]|uniref:Uncharacterized protein n=1 Tax=Candidatus Wolfebacteria bacterium GW2011_GWC1_43_10 TaxID=1619011 RepID=A0A0G1EDR4_9BACT|nr:MAG: hypothetical protein UV58_C0026G0001 [Candidatus Wolfebacteria bacterium GW2011_GWC1_43_10]
MLNLSFIIQHFLTLRKDSMEDFVETAERIIHESGLLFNFWFRWEEKDKVQIDGLASFAELKCLVNIMELCQPPQAVIDAPEG